LKVETKIKKKEGWNGNDREVNQIVVINLSEYERVYERIEIE
jgi:hypothetical protein